MNWLNLSVRNFATRPDISLAPADIVGIWVKVSIYCADKENGGRICGAAKWTDERWQKMVGVALAQVQSAAPLVRIRGDHVVVAYYPHAQEKRAKFLRSIGGIRRENDSVRPNTNGHPELMLEHKPVPKVEHKPQRKVSTRSAKAPPHAQAHAPPHARAHAPPHAEHMPTLISNQERGIGKKKEKRVRAPAKASGGLPNNFPSEEEALAWAREEGLTFTEPEVRYWHLTMTSKGWKRTSKGGYELWIHDWRAELKRSEWLHGAIETMRSEPLVSGMKKNGAPQPDSFDDFPEEDPEPDTKKRKDTNT